MSFLPPWRTVLFLLPALSLLCALPADGATQKRHPGRSHAKHRPKPAQPKPAKKPDRLPFRQPAYITNAYFSDHITAGEDGAVRPLSVVKALRNHPTEPLGHLILDLMLVTPGLHHLRVDILNQQGNKVGGLHYPPVQSVKQGDLPLYTAASPITGNFSAGLWFFKVFDQVNNGTWYALDTFSIVVLDTAAAERAE
ncbi:MAG: hypothetical protein HQL90_12185 [Magnetococcales bacterium]|nr:hypothetical protein [Magnetococcales bacterium]